ncbi:DUF7577 domain-containing protein [Halopiger goleimassiliensis]
MSSHGGSGTNRVTCRVCGTENDGFYTYCRSCLGSLPARPSAKR